MVYRAFLYFIIYTQCHMSKRKLPKHIRVVLISHTYGIEIIQHEIGKLIHSLLCNTHTGIWYELVLQYICGLVAQMVTSATRKPWVSGSNPSKWYGRLCFIKTLLAIAMLDVGFRYPGAWYIAHNTYICVCVTYPCEI